MRRPRLTIALCLAAAATGAVAPATAVAKSAAVADCYAHNALQGHYSISQLQNALATMPADVREYTNCYTIIQDQLFRQLGKPIPGSGGSGSGGSFISTPVLIAIIVIVVGGGGAALYAYRRRPPGGPGEPPDGPSDPSGP